MQLGNYLSCIDIIKGQLIFKLLKIVRLMISTDNSLLKSSSYSLPFLFRMEDIFLPHMPFITWTLKHIICGSITIIECATTHLYLSEL
jgi:hypothetical protein